jgi:hypothetical protein
METLRKQSVYIYIYKYPTGMHNTTRRDAVQVAVMGVCLEPGTGAHAPLSPMLRQVLCLALVGAATKHHKCIIGEVRIKHKRLEGFGGSHHHPHGDGQPRCASLALLLHCLP